MLCRAASPLTKTMGEQMNSDVVIIGAGPSGLVLAIALAHYKVRVRLTLQMIL